MIKRELVEEILLRTDIESLVSGYVSLKRAGSLLRGLCPFHSEKSPSFTVYPADNSFYCFGCGAGGDQVTFVKKIEHLDYPEAVEFLAKRVGITVVHTDDGNDGYQKIDKAKLLRMNIDAAKYFNACLFSRDPKAQAALTYFTDKRGLSHATIKHFGLGYAPDSYDAFSRYMISRGYTYDELVTGFLCARTEKGTYYDTFRNRVMFPIIDVSGNVIAFGGRVMDDSKPKYRNSSDTPVFKKSRNLFALNFARHTCQETLILCEGYMDVIALHTAGFTNAVATLGTAITQEQARLMSRYTKKVIISYDADEAGQKAAARAVGMLSDVGLDVGILSIPGAKDPDEYIKANGSDKFKTLIEGSKSNFEYNMDAIIKRYDVQIPRDKIKAIEELEKLISETYSSAERDVYIQTVAKKLGVEQSSLKSDIDKMISKRVYAFKRDESKKVRQSTAGFGDKVNPDFIKAPAVAKNEENVLGLLLLFKEHRKSVFVGNLLSEDDFVTDLNKRIFLYLKRSYADGNDSFADIDESFNSDELGRITKMKISRMSLTNNGSEALDEAVLSLKSAVQKQSSQKTNTYEGLNELLNKMRNS